MKIYLVTNPDGSHKIFKDKPKLVKTYRTDPPEEWVGQSINIETGQFPHISFPLDHKCEPKEAELIIRQKIDIKELKERLNGTKV